MKVSKALRAWMNALKDMAAGPDPAKLRLMEALVLRMLQQEHVVIYVLERDEYWELTPDLRFYQVMSRDILNMGINRNEIEITAIELNAKVLRKLNKDCRDMGIPELEPGVYPLYRSAFT